MKTETASIVICTPQETFWDKATPGLPALVISLVAVALSATSFFYTRSKDRRARAQSVEDDFWLRKVLSPSAIEPFVKMMGEIAAHLPSPASHNLAETKNWKDETLRELRSITASFVALRLLHPPLYEEVETKLGEIEDRLVTYLADLESHHAGQQDAPSRPEAVTQLTALGVAALAPIKKHQGEVGAN